MQDEAQDTAVMAAANTGRKPEGRHALAERHGWATVPVIPPGAAANVPDDDLGKCPGFFDGVAWRAFGVAGLEARRDTAEWDTYPHAPAAISSIGIHGRSHPWLDVDVTDDALAVALLDTVDDWLLRRFPARGVAPFRVGRPPKWAMVFRFVDPAGRAGAPSMDLRFRDPRTNTAHVIQLIGTGKHAVAEGIHPATGRAYDWQRMPVAGQTILDVPDTAVHAMTHDDLLALMDMLAGWLRTAGMDVHRGSVSDPTSSGAPAPAHLRAPGGLAQVKALMDRLPNPPSVFSGRKEWVDMAQALLGALPDNRVEAQELFVQWSDRYPYGQQENPHHEFAKAHASHRLGWQWIVDKARECGVADVAASATFDALDAETAALAASMGASPQAAAAATGAADADPFMPATAPAGPPMTDAERVRALAEGMGLMDGPLAALWEDEPIPATAPPTDLAALSGADALAALDALLDAGPDASARPTLDPSDPVWKLVEDASLAALPGTPLPPPRPFLYGTYYQRGTISLLSGAGGVSKTNMGLVEALAMIVDRPLLNVPIYEDDLRVLHVNLDEDTAELKRRVLMIAKTHSLDLTLISQRLFLMGREKAAGLRLTRVDARGRVQVDYERMIVLRALIRHLGVDVVQLDPLSAMMDGINDNDVGYSVLPALGVIAWQTDTALLLTTHNRKAQITADATPGSSADSIKGASALVQAARCARVMRPMTAQEAREEYGVPVDRAWRHVAVEMVKGNHSDPSVRALWVRLEVVGLGNALGRRPEDRTAVPHPWTPQPPVVSAQQRDEALRQIIDAAMTGRPYSTRDTSRRRGRDVVVQVCGVTAAVADDMLTDWIKAGWLVARPNGALEAGLHSPADTEDAVGF